MIRSFLKAYHQLVWVLVSILVLVILERWVATKRHSYDVLGDAVSTAASIESQV